MNLLLFDQLDEISRYLCGCMLHSVHVLIVVGRLTMQDLLRHWTEAYVHPVTSAGEIKRQRECSK